MKNGFRCNKISHFSTIILNKNTHKIIILGIIYFWVIFFNFTKMPKKPFSLRSVQLVHCTRIKYAKKNEKIRAGISFPPNEKIRFFVRNARSPLNH